LENENYRTSGFISGEQKK